MERTELERWFTVSHSADVNGAYRHTWCRQTEAGQWKKHLPSIVGYLERAHADARDYFHSTIHLSLDPVPSERKQPSYPHDMPLKAKKGFFGEALCGMFTEAMDIVGGESWIVPAFLFRLHREAAEHLFRLVMKEKVPKDIPGRTGTDFIAIAMGKDGRIKRFLSGEAKCHEIFNITQCKQFLKEIAEEGDVPVSLPQLVRILEDQDQGQLTEIIAAIDDLFLTKNFKKIPKSNLFLYIFDKPGVASYQTARITDELKTTSYISSVPLHIFEVCIPDGTELVETAYDRLYRGADANVAV
jgi:hypothetical protein